jgi:pimeloyl-ACP methyl ester carboxylesterase
MIVDRETSGPAGAPVLLMGSSLGTSREMWDGQLPLAERLRLVRYDHRGHGASPVPPPPYEIADLGRDVLALMDSLGIESASYCGLSIGGMVGMWLGANAPERIERLVLICTSAHMRRRRCGRTARPRSSRPAHPSRSPTASSSAGSHPASPRRTPSCARTCGR